MSEMTLGFDPSASMSKARYQIDENSAEWLMMPSSYLPVEAESIDLYKKTTTRTHLLAPEREAWLCIDGSYYVVGELAQSGFGASDHLRYLKYETLIPKILAMIGAIAQRKSVVGQIDLNLGLLLPYGEIKDVKRLEKSLKERGKCFIFNGQEYQLRVLNMMGHPEGFGVLTSGRQSHQRLGEQTILVLMIGYRNASYLLYDKGKVTGETSDYGFIRMLEKVVESTSGYKAHELVSPISQAGSAIRQKALEKVLRTTQPEERKWEMGRLREAIAQTRTQHLTLLKQWLESRHFPPIDEVIFTGGTAWYYRKELERLFSSGSKILSKAEVGWAEKLETPLIERLKYYEGNEYAYRLTDLYGYYGYLLQRIGKSVIRRVG